MTKGNRNMNDISKISDKNMLDNMKTLFRHVSESGNICDNSHTALIAIAEESDDPDFIEAVIKSAKWISCDDARMLAKRLCEIQNTDSNIYLEVSNFSNPWPDEPSEDHYDPESGFYHLRLLVEMYYGDIDKKQRRVVMRDFMEYRNYPHEEIFKMIDEYVYNRSDHDNRKLQEKIDEEKSMLRYDRISMAESAKQNKKYLAEKEKEIAEKEKEIAKLTKELEGQKND